MHDWVGVPPPSKQQMEELTESERKSQGLHPSKMAREELLAWLYAPIARTEFDSIEDILRMHQVADEFPLGVAPVEQPEVTEDGAQVLCVSDSEASSAPSSLKPTDSFSRRDIRRMGASLTSVVEGEEPEAESDGGLTSRRSSNSRCSSRTPRSSRGQTPRALE